MRGHRATIEVDPQTIKQLVEYAAAGCTVPDAYRKAFQSAWRGTPHTFTSTEQYHRNAQAFTKHRKAGLDAKAAYRAACEEVGLAWPGAFDPRPGSDDTRRSWEASEYERLRTVTQ